MNFQTKIPLQSQEPEITYDSEIVMLGSCFAQNISKKLEYFKFKNICNPFGVLFHPKAIETFLWMVTQEEKYVDTDLFFHNEQWHCFDAHSSMSASNKDVLRSGLNERLAFTRNKLQSATHVFITLGTAWVYRLAALDMVVANCHKIPQKEFAKELLSIDEIKQCLHNCERLIHSLNPSIKIVFTVSPVRHIKDGYVENTRSKSHLISAIHSVRETNNNVAYFPSYEIMMDELRDYRFYATDMIHPSDLAIQYIWKRFSDVWMPERVKKTMLQVEEIQKGLAHRPFNPQSKQHLAFLQNLEQKKQKLQQEYSTIKF